MASSLSKLDIWCAALDLLREEPLASVDDDTASALWLKRNYPIERDYLLGHTYLWKFAMTRELLSADPTAPAWDWQYRYAIPATWLRIIPPTENGQWNGRPIPFEEENGYILCDVEGGLRMRAIKRVEQEGLFSTGFCSVLSVRLAYRMAHWMTGKQSMVADLRQEYKDTLMEVKQTAAVQVAAESYYDTDILDDRVAY